MRADIQHNLTALSAVPILLAKAQSFKFDKKQRSDIGTALQLHSVHLAVIRPPSAARGELLTTSLGVARRLLVYFQHQFETQEHVTTQSMMSELSSVRINSALPIASATHPGDEQHKSPHIMADDSRLQFDTMRGAQHCLLIVTSKNGTVINDLTLIEIRSNGPQPAVAVQSARHSPDTSPAFTQFTTKLAEEVRDCIHGQSTKTLGMDHVKAFAPLSITFLDRM